MQSVYVYSYLPKKLGQPVNDVSDDIPVIEHNPRRRKCCWLAGAGVVGVTALAMVFARGAITSGISGVRLLAPQLLRKSNTRHHARTFEEVPDSAPTSGGLAYTPSSSANTDSSGVQQREETPGFVPSSGGLANTPASSANTGSPGVQQREETPDSAKSREETPDSTPSSGGLADTPASSANTDSPGVQQRVETPDSAKSREETPDSTPSSGGLAYTPLSSNTDSPVVQSEKESHRRHLRSRTERGDKKAHVLKNMRMW